jgi:hypothetical protein
MTEVEIDHAHHAKRSRTFARLRSGGGHTVDLALLPGREGWVAFTVSLPCWPTGKSSLTTKREIAIELWDITSSANGLSLAP